MSKAPDTPVVPLSMARGDILKILSLGNKFHNQVGQEKFLQTIFKFEILQQDGTSAMVDYKMEGSAKSNSTRYNFENIAGKLSYPSFWFMVYHHHP